MTGHAMPWNREPSGQQKEDAKAARELTQKQTELQARQERELKQRRKALQTQQIAMLRSRFSVAGGGAGRGVPGDTPQSMSDTSSSLFGRITGR